MTNERFSMATPERLVVPLDGSPTAEKAVPVAQRLAESLDRPVRVLHVFQSIGKLRHAAEGDIQWSDDADPRAVISPPAFMREVIESSRESGIDVEVIGRVGKPTDEICKELQDSGNSWTVMSSLGSGGIRRLFLGSTSREVIRTAATPVLLVPSGTEHYIHSAEGSDRITVLVDGTSQSEGAISHAASLVSGAGFELELLRVAETYRDNGESSSDEDSRWETEAREEVSRYLNRVAAECQSLNIPIRTTVLSGNPLVQIVRYVKESSPRFVALATRKRSGIERWTYGSVAEKLVDAVPLPLLLVPVADD